MVGATHTRIFGTIPRKMGLRFAGAPAFSLSTLLPRALLYYYSSTPTTASCTLELLCVAYEFNLIRKLILNLNGGYPKSWHEQHWQHWKC